jgi:hypothetical protein
MERKEVSLMHSGGVGRPAPNFTFEDLVLSIHGIDGVLPHWRMLPSGWPDRERPIMAVIFDRVRPSGW